MREAATEAVGSEGGEDDEERRDRAAALLPTDDLGRLDALRRLTPVLKRHRRGVALTLITAIGNQFSGIAAASVAAFLTGYVAVDPDLGRVTALVWLLGGLAVTKGVFAWAESWVAHDMAFRVMLDLRSEVFDGLVRLAPAWLFGRRTGDVAAAALADVEALEWFYAHTAAQVTVTVLTPLGALGVIAVVDPRLALALAPFVVAVGAVPLALLRRGDREGRAIREGLGRLQAETTDVVQGLRELVLFGAGGRWRKRLADSTTDLAAAQEANASRIGLENGATEGLLAGAMLSVLITGALLVDAGELPRATYPVTVVLAGLALAPVTVLTGGIRNLGVLRATASRVVAVIDAPARVSEPSNRADISEAVHDDLVGGQAPTVRFDSVRFGYEPDVAVLKGVNFEVPSSSTVALVGASGAGKSTCANLLLRFWDPDEGAIRLAGVDLRELPLPTLRRAVSLVPQDPYLFRGTIADNLRLAAPDATDSELRGAAEQALVSEFTDALPGGLDTAIGERGVTLSGGQRQRIALAQALLRDASVLVLDEAVAAIDTMGEQLLQRAIARARRDRTTLVIAHRLSTIASADHVVVLRDGQVAQLGEPAALLEQPGPFRALVARQLGGTV